MENTLQTLLQKILDVPSPTYQEQELVAFLKKYLTQQIPGISWIEKNDSLICIFSKNKEKPHVALVGHLDVVPKYFPFKKNGDLFYGAGASDMKSALACYIYLMQQYSLSKKCPFQLSFLFYAREEGTPLIENGIYQLMQHFPDYFNSLHLVIIGEPTNNTIQLGCVGSIHVYIYVYGKSCHSARAWEGKNALYEAIPVLQKIASYTPVKQTIFGVDFFEVLQITESQSEPGRTTVPGWWKANVNFRFTPLDTLESAKKKLYRILIEAGLSLEQIEWRDGVEAGAVLETELFQNVVRELNVPIQAKQAWTDVAQLTQKGIPAFNYGPGFTSQAHCENEYGSFSELEKYCNSLQKLFKLTETD